MAKIAYWTQRADFKSAEHSPVDLAAATKVVESHPWSQERTLARELEAAGSDSCPPGIGFTPPDGRIFHAAAKSGGDFDCFYHYPAKHKVLGLFPITRQQTAVYESLTLGEVLSLLESFFADDNTRLLGTAV